MMAKRLAREGVDFFAVATLLEGKELRDAQITGEILVLSYTDPSLTSELLACGLIQSVSSPEYAAALDEAARAAGGRLKAHIKLDTGMTLTGFDCGTCLLYTSFIPYGVKFKELRKDTMNMEQVQSIFVQVIHKPERQVILKRGVKAQDYFCLLYTSRCV